ncbi:hypothetical protein BHE90_009573 [Fusarium euwallaceae]|uniref:Uncharacterized protein n=2 Tax=Fusarium solani species complex TaxID=232080 RepID=A0A3M2S5S8_9HYPO|nr:hypothetical protein CDV36_007415 [Fusarium kuroshium]RTE75953.1 hypothetical protein BHE90_009573 [Fusarium euwallaceae]
MADGSNDLDEWFTHGDSISASDCRPSRVHFMVAVPEYSPRSWPGPANGYSRVDQKDIEEANRQTGTASETIVGGL